MKNTANQQLYNLLVSKDFEPEQFNSGGASILDPDDADLIKFDYKSRDGKNYGTVQILFGEDGEMTVFFGDNVGRSMEPDDKEGWFNFLEQLRKFAMRNRLSFNLENINRMKFVLKGMNQIRESVMESLVGNRTQSWSKPDSGARLFIQHSRRLEEGDARFRHIDKIFVETTDGERFKLPFKNLSGARAMLEHVRQGGRPYDHRGQHICEMVTEINTLSRFRRAHHGRVFEGSTQNIVETANQYYEQAKHTLKSLGNSRGYDRYFESWNPSNIDDTDIMVEDLRTMFIEQTLDQRIESALPLLAKLRNTQMKEASEFEIWSNRLLEGTWSVPDTPEKLRKLTDLMANELPVGPDATNATEQLYDIFGDDILFDRLDTLALADPDADARELIAKRMEELGMEVPEISTAPTGETPPAEEPAAPAGPPAQPAGQAPTTPPPPMVETDDITDPKEIGAKMNPAYVSPAAQATKPTADQLAAKAAPQPPKIPAKTTPIPKVQFESELDKIKRLALGH
jgi:hypothetical protein